MALVEKGWAESTCHVCALYGWSKEAFRGRRLDLEIVSRSPSKKASSCKKGRRVAEHPRWFLIIDNVDTVEAAREVENLLNLEQLRGGHIVITTRLRNWSSRVKLLDLDVLGEAAAVDFLKERTAHRACVPTDFFLILIPDHLRAGKMSRLQTRSWYTIHTAPPQRASSWNGGP